MSSRRACIINFDHHRDLERDLNTLKTPQVLVEFSNIAPLRYNLKNVANFNKMFMSY